MFNIYNMISLKQVDSALKEVFNDTRVQMMDSVYELSKDEKFYKLVFSIHNLDAQVDDEVNTIIIHTKFIFRTNLEKTKLIEPSFWYLSDINCIYKKVNFDNESGLIRQLNTIINENSFGEDVKNISNFISEAPASSINDFLSKSGVENFTITNVNYNPKLKMFPCEDTKFDFDLDLNNGEYKIELSIEKKDQNEFNFFYYIEGENKEFKVENISQLPQLIGDHLLFIQDKFLS